MSDENVILSLTPDEALVLFEMFARFGASDRLTLDHAAEYLALQRVSAQLDKALVTPFDPAYATCLEAARARVAAGFQGEYPGGRLDAE